MNAQTCKECLVEKPLDEFFKNSVKANGRDSKCKECRKASAREYRREHADKISAQRREAYASNRETLLARKQAYYRDNVDRLLAQKSKYWGNNKEKIKKRVDAWRHEHRSVLANRAKEHRNALIESVIIFLGGVCAFCGEAEKEFLTVDHTDNDGNSQRHLGSVGWKRKILDGTFDASRYRVLCHNCNLGRYRKDPVHHLSNRPRTGVLKTCRVCRIDKDSSEFPSTRRGSSSSCLACNRSRQIARRKAMTEALGGRCRCCGIDEWSKLVVDHVDNDGGARRKRGERSGIDLLSAVTRGDVEKTGFQLLCWNCNHSKHRGSGMCIHQRNGTSLMSGVTPVFRNADASSSLKTIEFNMSDAEIVRIDVGECRIFLNKHHYAGFGRPSSILYAAKIKEEAIAVAKFASPIRQGIAATVGVCDGQVLELDRFCVHPAYHAKNFASFFMSKVLKFLAKDRPDVLKLVSFADPRFGHSGTIYQASNWNCVGKTARGYYYEDRNGLEVNKKTLYDFAKRRKMTERQCIEALGYRKVHTPPKIKFVYDMKR